jgi:hypothetical protein
MFPAGFVASIGSGRRTKEYTLEIIDKLNTEINVVLAEPKIRARLADWELRRLRARLPISEGSWPLKPIGGKVIRTPHQADYRAFQNPNPISVISGGRAAASPESISPGCGYGFRPGAYAPSRMTAVDVIGFMNRWSSSPCN